LLCLWVLFPGPKKTSHVFTRLKSQYHSRFLFHTCLFYCNRKIHRQTFLFTSAIWHSVNKCNCVVLMHIAQLFSILTNQYYIHFWLFMVTMYIYWLWGLVNEGARKKKNFGIIYWICCATHVYLGIFYYLIIFQCHYVGKCLYNNYFSYLSI
jgi:hypothetical protein